jgi:RND family efflux transporter MFP subunit
LLGTLVRAALPVGILAAGCLAYAILSVKPEEKQSPPAEEQVLRTRVTTLQVGDYPVVIKTNGIVQAHNQVTLNAEVSGQITRISREFEVGSYFSEGDVLVELDARDHATASAVAQARFLGAWSALKLATVNLERNTKLFRMGYGAEASVQQATATYEQTSAELDAATAQVERAKRDLDRTKILAPFDGRVRRRMVGLGQSVGSGTPLGVVFAVDYAEVRLPIKARELQYLNLPEMPEDPPVEVELRDAISETSDTVWRAKVVRTEGTLDEDSLELFAIARIDDPFGRNSGHPPLRIEQPVVASIAGTVLENVVALPRGAVRQLDQIFLVDKTELTLISKTIVPIWKDEEFVFVREPLLKDGTLLATTHLVYAPDGAKVEIIPEVELTETATTTSNTNEAEPTAKEG